MRPTYSIALLPPFSNRRLSVPPFSWSEGSLVKQTFFPCDDIPLWLGRSLVPLTFFQYVFFLFSTRLFLGFCSETEVLFLSPGDFLFRWEVSIYPPPRPFVALSLTLKNSVFFECDIVWTDACFLAFVNLRDFPPRHHLSTSATPLQSIILTPFSPDQLRHAFPSRVVVEFVLSSLMPVMRCHHFLLFLWRDPELLFLPLEVPFSFFPCSEWFFVPVRKKLGVPLEGPIFVSLPHQVFQAFFPFTGPFPPPSSLLFFFEERKTFLSRFSFRFDPLSPYSF